MTSLLQDELLISTGLLSVVTSNGESYSLVDWARRGSVLEDEMSEIIRPMRHFYDPVVDRGLRIGSQEWQDALTWAISSTENDWNLYKLSEHYRDMLTLALPAGRNNAAGKTFRAVGHFMHMIQDMAQPQHTRNDAHRFDGWLEYYGDANYGTVGALAGLSQLTYIVAPAPPRFILHEPLPYHRKYRHYFDTNQYTGQVPFLGFQAGPPGLAEYSNYNFVSPDTIFINEYPYPSKQQTDYDLVFPAALKAALTVSGGIVQPLGGYVRKTAPAGPGEVTNCLMFAGRDIGPDVLLEYYLPMVSPVRIFVGMNHPPVLEDHSQILLPKAIAYCTDFANLYFRGRFETSLLGNVQTQKLELTISNQTGNGVENDTLTNGTWMLMQDNEVGTRTAVDTNFATYPGTLAHGESFVVEFNPTGRTGAFTLVFVADGAPNDSFRLEVVAKSFEEPVGACCVNGNCTIRVQPECDALGGTFLGENTTCDLGCPGACCLPDGRCLQATLNICDVMGGTFHGGASDCADCPGFGACCLADGTCASNLTAAACQQQGGAYHGDNTSCFPNPCPQPVQGACCSPSGQCSVTSQSNCTAGGGTWLGEGSTCDPNPCSGGSSGKCCLPSGYCVSGLTEVTCQALGGNTLGVCYSTGYCCNTTMVQQCPQQLTLTLPAFTYNAYTQNGVPYVVSIGVTTHHLTKQGTAWHSGYQLVGTGTIEYPTVPCIRTIDVWTSDTVVGCYLGNDGSKGWWALVSTIGLTGQGCDYMNGSHSRVAYYTRPGSCQGTYEEVHWGCAVCPTTITVE